jgi:hypothetical protein
VRRAIVQTLRGFGWRQWLVVALFVLVLGATALHAARTFQRARYWREHRDEPIRAWMTVGYVAHSYRVPPRALYQALDLPPRDPGSPRDRRPLREIAREQGRTLEEISAALQQAIERERAAQNTRGPRAHTPNSQNPETQLPGDHPQNAPPAHPPPRDGGRP